MTYYLQCEMAVRPHCTGLKILRKSIPIATWIYLGLKTPKITLSKCFNLAATGLQLGPIMAPCGILLGLQTPVKVNPGPQLASQLPPKLHKDLPKVESDSIFVTMLGRCWIDVGLLFGAFYQLFGTGIIGSLINRHTDKPANKITNKVTN